MAAATELQVPYWQVLVGFNNGPFDDPTLITATRGPAGNLGASMVWTDISQWVLGFNYRRGRQHELQSFDAGQMTVDLWNADSRFSPWNTSGPYTPHVDLMKPVQLRATTTTDNLFTAPDSDFETLTGVSWFATNASLGQASVHHTGTESLSVTASSSGAAAVTTTAYVIPNLTGEFSFSAWVRAAATGRTATATVLMPDGSSFSASAADNSSGWTHLTFPGTVDGPQTGAASISVSWAGCATSETHYLDTCGLWLDTPAPTWEAGTVAGCGTSHRALTGNPMFTGLAKSWPMQWPDDAISTAQLTVVDHFALFNQIGLYNVGYEAEVLADGATAYYEMSDPIGSANCADSGPNNYTGTYVNVAGAASVIALGQPGALAADLTTSANFEPDGQNLSGYVNVPVAAGVTGTEYTIEAWVNLNTGASFGNIYMQEAAGGDTVQLAVSSGSVVFTATDAFADVLEVVTISAPITPTVWHHIFVSRIGTTCNITVDGVFLPVTTSPANNPINVTPATVTIAGQTNSVGGETADWPGSLAHVALYQGIYLLPAVAATHYELGALGGTPETSDARLNRVLDAVGWPAGARHIDTGDSVLGGVNPSTGSTLLSYVQAIDQTESGLCFMNTAGQVRFVARYNVILDANAGPAATFGDDVVGGETPIDVAPTLALDDLDTYNLVIAQSQASGTHAQQAAQDATSLAKYGQHSLSSTSLMFNLDSDVYQYAAWIVSKYKTPLVRVAVLALRPNTDQSSALTDILTGLEIGSFVEANRHTIPGAPTAFAEYAMVEQISHTFAFKDYDWKAMIALSPADTARYWIAADPVYGVAGTAVAAF